MLHPEFSSSFYQLVLDNVYDGVYCTDTQRRILYWNHGAEKFTGFLAAEVVGTRCCDNVLNHVDAEGQLFRHAHCPLAATLEDGDPRSAAVFLHHKDGSRRPVLVRTAAIRDSESAIIGGVEVFSDNSATLAVLEQVKSLESLAYVDSLTSLPNRRYAQTALGNRLEEMRRYGWGVAVLVADVDRFKRVNDQYGHPAGDQVLQMVASTLSHAARSFDIVARWGGEEFVVVLPHVDDAGLRAAANRFRALVERSELSLGHEALRVTISIGGALAVAGDTEESLFDRADRAMFRAKAAGRNCVRFELDDEDADRKDPDP